jgi:DNA-binding LytR/AlgR family response regulator
MRILIIEDEPRAVNQLQNLLKESNFDYQLLEIIDSVQDAILWFGNNTSPDLVFLDIQLADGLSFEIFQKVDVTAPIIFPTAFDQYAIQAFKVNSVDYLLKPIQKSDLDHALTKFKNSKKFNSIEPAILKQLLGSIQSKPTRQGVLVKEGGGFVQIRIVDLLYIYSDGGITFGVTSSKRYIIEETMDMFSEDLNQEQFFRINRGQIISKRSVEKISPYFNHRIKLTITNPRDQDFIVSRQKTSEFKIWMNR